MANKKETKTHFNYNRLWKLLIDRGIQKQELQNYHYNFAPGNND